MEELTLSNKTVSVILKKGGSSLAIEELRTGASCELDLPAFEIDMETIVSYEPVGITGERKLLNGGTEICFAFRPIGRLEMTLQLYLRVFSGSPFIRFKYVLGSEQPVRMTKRNRRDNITYTAFKYKGEGTCLSELQLSQFESIVHSFIPHFEKYDENFLKEGVSFPGPVVLVENQDKCCLMAYEHGAEYPDSYLNFEVNKTGDSIHISIRARKSNYCSDQIIDRNHPFKSVWFHIAQVGGDRGGLFKAYREFFLKYICENLESRKPYIFYNTWNNQERNKYFKGMKYLDSMYLEHILKEIDIAYRMGIDVFVIDTGWYNKTGDWIVNPERFPDGLRTVKQKLDSYGMKLGLWFNPIVAAKTSAIYLSHPEYVMRKDGKENFWGSIWETEESYGMCLVSEYSDYFIEKLVQLHKELGVIYFKWDAIGQYGCNSPHHNHGTDENSEQERLECYSYNMGLAMIRIVEEVTRRCPKVIVDFDITEGGRFVGIGFLSVGKYFLMNNGPYFSSFDIPKTVRMEPDTINVFFYPGPARAKVCRQGVRFDPLIPSLLFLTHFLPDLPRSSQVTSLASLMLGGNGIWGDLLSLSEDDIELFRSTLDKYKKVAHSITCSYPKIRGFIGSSPEIYEKLDYEKSEGLVCFFTRARGEYLHITGKINCERFSHVDGADSYELTRDGRLRIRVILEENESRPVFIFSTDSL